MKASQENPFQETLYFQVGHEAHHGIREALTHGVGQILFVGLSLSFSFIRTPAYLAGFHVEYFLVLRLIYFAQ